MRDHRTHLGRVKTNFSNPETGIVVPQVYMLITSLSWQDWEISWIWDFFWSPQKFDEGAKPISDLRVKHWLDTQDFVNFETTNSDLVSKIKTRFRNLCLPSPSNEAVFSQAEFDTVGYKLDIEFEDGGKLPGCHLRGQDYHSTIAANMDVIGFDGQLNPGLIPILHAISAQKNPGIFENSDLVLPPQ